MPKNAPVKTKAKAKAKAKKKAIIQKAQNELAAGALRKSRKIGKKKDAKTRKA